MEMPSLLAVVSMIFNLVFLCVLLDTHDELIALREAVQAPRRSLLGPPKTVESDQDLSLERPVERGATTPPPGTCPDATELQQALDTVMVRVSELEVHHKRRYTTWTDKLVERRRRYNSTGLDAVRR
jgi:hypothetical protein